MHEKAVRVTSGRLFHTLIKKFWSVEPNVEPNKANLYRLYFCIEYYLAGEIWIRVKNKYLNDESQIEG